MDRADGLALLQREHKYRELVRSLRRRQLRERQLLLAALFELGNARGVKDTAYFAKGWLDERRNGALL